METTTTPASSTAAPNYARLMAAAGRRAKEITTAEEEAELTNALETQKRIKDHAAALDNALYAAGIPLEMFPWIDASEVKTAARVFGPHERARNIAIWIQIPEAAPIYLLARTSPEGKAPRIHTDGDGRILYHAPWHVWGKPTGYNLQEVMEYAEQQPAGAIARQAMIKATHYKPTADLTEAIARALRVYPDYRVALRSTTEAVREEREKLDARRQREAEARKEENRRNPEALLMTAKSLADQAHRRECEADHKTARTLAMIAQTYAAIAHAQIAYNGRVRHDY